MQRIVSFLVFTYIVLLGSNALGQSPNPGGYISGKIGFGIRPDADISITPLPFENDPARVLNVAFGLELNPMIRIEGEIGVHVNDAKQGGTGIDWTFGTVSFMGNGYFDIPTNSPLRPYLGAGLGFAVVNLEIYNSDRRVARDSDLVAAFQLMAGLGYDISPKTTLTFGYSYFTTTDPSYNDAFGSFETEYTSHEFLFGARFRF